ncbi:hypothetical protein GCM10008014_39030 [Paenibacillus silvae]|uniref:EfeO-type cupredoxin-like domain-containing protein n=1 Tax=Paenibacillus silvae TaxID=1325358 RepID=A0ABQ1ZHN2_9BACL|nr:cupredoxin family copper-binding protein [Paenibacillus silvae]GGH62504.1 hypothetical protein GCM10008014_39030 [Paenibacillus silvae]
MNKRVKVVSMVMVLGVCLGLPQLAAADASASMVHMSSNQMEAHKDHASPKSDTTGKKTVKPSKKKSESSKSSKDKKKVADAKQGQSKTYVIEISNFMFQTAELKIKVGDRVEFVNKDQVEHSAVAEDGSFDTGMLAEGKKSVITFKKAGDINYYCGAHPSMKAVIKVLSK